MKEVQPGTISGHLVQAESIIKQCRVVTDAEYMLKKVQEAKLHLEVAEIRLKAIVAGECIECHQPLQPEELSAVTARCFKCRPPEAVHEPV